MDVAGSKSENVDISLALHFCSYGVDFGVEVYRIDRMWAFKGTDFLA